MICPHASCALRAAFDAALHERNFDLAEALILAAEKHLPDQDDAVPHRMRDDARAAHLKHRGALQ